MTIPDEAVRAAALVLSSVEGQYDEDDWNMASDMVRAAAPFIAAAERERIIALAVTRGAVYANFNGEDLPFATLLEAP